MSGLQAQAAGPENATRRAADQARRRQRLAAAQNRLDGFARQGESHGRADGVVDVGLVISVEVDDLSGAGLRAGIHIALRRQRQLLGGTDADARRNIGRHPRGSDIKSGCRCRGHRTVTGLAQSLRAGDRSGDCGPLGGIADTGRNPLEGGFGGQRLEFGIDAGVRIEARAISAGDAGGGSGGAQRCAAGGEGCGAAGRDAGRGGGDHTVLDDIAGKDSADAGQPRNRRALRPSGEDGLLAGRNQQIAGQRQATDQCTDRGA